MKRSESWCVQMSEKIDCDGVKVNTHCCSAYVKYIKMIFLMSIFYI